MPLNLFAGFRPRTRATGYATGDLAELAPFDNSALGTAVPSKKGIEHEERVTAHILHEWDTSYANWNRFFAVGMVMLSTVSAVLASLVLVYPDDARLRLTNALFMALFIGGVVSFIAFCIIMVRWMLTFHGRHNTDRARVVDHPVRSVSIGYSLMVIALLLNIYNGAIFFSMLDNQGIFNPNADVAAVPNASTQGSIMRSVLNYVTGSAVLFVTAAWVVVVPAFLVLSYFLVPGNRILVSFDCGSYRYGMEPNMRKEYTDFSTLGKCAAVVLTAVPGIMMVYGIFGFVMLFSPLRARSSWAYACAAAVVPIVRGLMIVVARVENPLRQATQRRIAIAYGGAIVCEVVLAIAPLTVVAALAASDVITVGHMHYLVMSLLLSTMTLCVFLAALAAFFVYFATVAAGADDEAELDGKTRDVFRNLVRRSTYLYLLGQTVVGTAIIVHVASYMSYYKLETDTTEEAIDHIAAFVTSLATQGLLVFAGLILMFHNAFSAIIVRDASTVAQAEPAAEEKRAMAKAKAV